MEFEERCKQFLEVGFDFLLFNSEKNYYMVNHLHDERKTFYYGKIYLDNAIDIIECPN
jgi:hypothetical protein